jgi:tetratricopeptide (TPR) repeat protein
MRGPLHVLHIPDDPSWWDEDSYSSCVHEVLEYAHTHLRHGHATIALYARVAVRLQRARHQSMAPQQRINLSFIYAQCLAALRSYPAALDCLDEALDLAVFLQDPMAFAEIAYLRGSTSVMLLRYTEAAVDQTLCIEVLRDLAEAGEHPDPQLYLYALLARASTAFNLANWSDATQLLDESLPLLRFAHNPLRESAAHEWIRALICRWTNASDRGLAHAIQAADMLLQLGPSEAAGRIQTVVSDIALDLAHASSASGPRRGRAAYLALAQPYIVGALQMAPAHHDAIGEGLALLAEMRYKLLTTDDVPHIQQLESIVQQGLILQDTALTGQAYVVLGSQFAARGDFDQARGALRAARDTLGPTDNRALDLWAQRMWLQLQEMHP